MRMMPDGRELERLQARVQVYGYMLAYALKLTYRALQLPEDEIQQFHSEILEQMRRETFPKHDPAMSDHWAGLLEEELAALVSAIETLPNEPPDEPLS